MKIAEDIVEAAIVIPALMAHHAVAKKENPSIVDVAAVAPFVADKMKELGYTELTKELLTAFRKHGIIRDPSPEDFCLFAGDLTRRFLHV